MPAQSAAVLPDGGLGPWRPEAQLPQPLALHGCAQAQGFLYVLAGQVDARDARI